MTAVMKFLLDVVDQLDHSLVLVLKDVTQTIVLLLVWVVVVDILISQAVEVPLVTMLVRIVVGVDSVLVDLSKCLTRNKLTGKIKWQI
jgi:hypothetical protein